MNELTEREKELVAIGASIGSNCVPCIAYHVGNARKAGLSDTQIEAAVVLSEEIRKVPAALVVDTARAYLQGKPSSEIAGSEKCGCNNSVSEFLEKNSENSKCEC